MATKKIVIDPITRIEGHLRIEATIDTDTKEVTDAFSSSTMFRGLESIMKGRDPRDCGLIAMRICGVCTFTHYQRSIEAVENAFGITIPTNARLVRNITQAALFMHDHLVHYYHLHSLDWVDVVSAMSADATDALAEVDKYAKMSGKSAYNTTVEPFNNTLLKLKKLRDSGRLGLFANGYWGNSSYKLTPEQNLVAMTHYFQALELQRDLGKMIAIFGGKDPHPQSMVVGGVTSIMDIKNSNKREDFKALANKVKSFIKGAYILDMYMLADAYSEEMKNGIGAGLKNLLVYGGFPLEDGDIYQAEKLFPGGIVYNGNLNQIVDFDPDLVTEDVTHSWYNTPQDPHPFNSTTEPNYTGFKEKINNIAYLDTDNKYSWIKSPLYNDTRVEVGPLARFMVGYARGDSRLKGYIDSFVTNSTMDSIDNFYSSVGRTVARALESELMADIVNDWVDELSLNVNSGNFSSWTKFDFNAKSQSAKGYGLEEAPRGSLGHWIKIENGKVVNYQAVVPSTWNAAPRDSKGRKGAYEKSLEGVTLSSIDEPLEILRTVHSFDPCIACAVHLIDTNGNDIKKFKVGYEAC